MVTIDNKQAFSDRFSAILDSAGIPPKGKNRQGIVAKLFDVSDKAARKWLEGESIPKTSRLAGMVEQLKATGATVEWLLTGNPSYAPELILKQGKLTYNEVQDLPNIDYAPRITGFVPLISWVQAGAWQEAIELYPPGDAEEKLPCPIAHSRNTYALKVKGDSMTAPYSSQHSYTEGTIIFVDPDRTLTNGCRVIAKLPNSNEVTFKEYREDGGRRYLKPLNPQYQIQEINDDTILCGVVIGQFKAE